MLRPSSKADHFRSILFLGAVASASAALAQGPAINFDLRVHDTGGKEALVTSIGQTVNLDVYEFVYGQNETPEDEGAYDSFGTFRSSTGGLLGDLLGLTPPAPFNLSASGGGTLQDLDGDGDLDLGANSTQLSDDFYFIRGRQDGMPPGGFYVGRAQFTVTSLAGNSTELTYTPISNFIVTVAAAIDGANVGLQSDDPRLSIGAPVTIRAGAIIDPGTEQFLDGTYTPHLKVEGTVKPTAGKTLAIATGIDVTSTGVFDARTASGGYDAANTIAVVDQISGNAGGTLLAPRMDIGQTAAGTFTQSAGFTVIGGAGVTVRGAGATGGKLLISGGSFSASEGSISGAGVLRQTGGSSRFTNLLIGGVASPALEISAGDMTVIDQATILGTTARISGTGAFEANKSLAIEPAAGFPTKLQVTGGSVITPDLSATGALVIEQSGGSVSAGKLRLMPSAPNDTVYRISSGSLTAGVFWIGGGAGATRFEQSGGDVTVTASWFFDPGSRYDLSAGHLTSTAGTTVGGFLDQVIPSEFNQSGGSHVSHELTIGGGGTYMMSGGTLEVTKSVRMGSTGTLDLTNAPVTLTFDQNCFADFSKGAIANAGSATFVGGPGSLMNFAAGFDPLTQIGDIQTQGLIHIAGEPLEIPRDKSVGGSGTIEGDVTNAGALAPGNSPGVIAITGDYLQDPTGALVMELAGTKSDEFDTLAVSGSASVDGSLSVSLLDDFVPAASDQFTILTAASLLGHFANAPDHVDVNGGRFDVIYSPNSVTLSNFVAAVPEPVSLGLLFAATPLLARRRRH
jgi:hypothetical protein